MKATLALTVLGGHQGEIRDEQKVMDIIHQIHSIVKGKKRNLDKGLINDLYVCGALRNQEHLCLMGCFGVVEYEC